MQTLQRILLLKIHHLTNGKERNKILANLKKWNSRDRVARAISDSYQAPKTFPFRITIRPTIQMSLKHKSELIGQLDVKTTAMTDTLQKLDNK